MVYLLYYTLARVFNGHCLPCLSCLLLDYGKYKMFDAHEVSFNFFFVLH